MPSFKKARIRPFTRIGHAYQHHDDEEGYQLLCNVITEILHKNTKHLSYELIYRTVYKLTLHQHGERLYDAVKRVITGYLDQAANAITAPAVGPLSTSNLVSDGDADATVSFLKSVELLWDDYTITMTMIHYALYYLDARLPSYNLPHVYDMGLDLFRDKIVRSEKYPVQHHLIHAILYQIQLERLGFAIDRSAIKSLVSMLSELLNSNSRVTVYATDFEIKFLEASALFYQAESQTLANNNVGAPEFMHKVETRVFEEEERTTHYLSLLTMPKIWRVVTTQLIANNLTTIMEMPDSGLDSMLNAEKYEDLSRMYSLFSLVSPGLNEMKFGISKYILERGKQLNQLNHTGPTSTTGNATKSKATAISGGYHPGVRWVEQVLELQAKVDRILNTSTNKDKAFQTSFNEAFQLFINENTRSAEWISLFINENLKKGKCKTEDEIDEQLDKAILLFRFLRDKDVFERYYRTHLAKRLILGRSFSDDAERNMLGKLKRECGYQIISKLEGMLNDMQLTVEMNSQLKHYNSQATNNKEVDTTVTVLTTTYWPMNATTQSICILPANISTACRSFEHFYHDRHSGRRLTWQYQLGTADIEARFKSSKHILNIPTYGMIVLLLFNATSSGISWKQIKLETSIPESNLNRILQSLTCSKYRVLVKTGEGRDIQPDERFSVNNNFTSNTVRIKIQVVTTKDESNSEQQHIQHKVGDERQYQIEAAVVRILKSRRTIDHSSLIAETIKQLSSRFMPDPTTVKKRIEALIDREYLERNSNDRQIYHYLA